MVSMVTCTVVLDSPYIVWWYVDVATCIAFRLAVLGLWRYWSQTIASRLFFQCLPSPTQCKVVRSFVLLLLQCVASPDALAQLLDSGYPLHYIAQETREPPYHGNIGITSLYNRSLCISVFLQSRLIVLEHLLHYTVLHNTNMLNVASILECYHSFQCYKWSGNETMQWLASLILKLSLSPLGRMENKPNKLSVVTHGVQYVHTGSACIKTCFYFLTAGSFYSQCRAVHTEEMKFEHSYEF